MENVFVYMCVVLFNNPRNLIPFVRGKFQFINTNLYITVFLDRMQNLYICSYER